MVINARFDDVNEKNRCLLTYLNKNDQLHTCKVKEMLHVYGSGNGSIKFNLIWSSLPDMMMSVIK